MNAQEKLAKTTVGAPLHRPRSALHCRSAIFIEIHTYHIQWHDSHTFIDDS